jgi:hypothetical protein
MGITNSCCTWWMTNRKNTKQNHHPIALGGEACWYWKCLYWGFVRIHLAIRRSFSQCTFVGPRWGHFQPEAYYNTRLFECEHSPGWLVWRSVNDAVNKLTREIDLGLSRAGARPISITYGPSLRALWRCTEGNVTFLRVRNLHLARGNGLLYDRREFPHAIG